MIEHITMPVYPARLLDWAGNRVGGVRRPFDDTSGRPGGKVFSTNLLSKLYNWCIDVSSGSEATPRILMLVGGPGNGKTDAIETTIGWLDTALGCSGSLIHALSNGFQPDLGKVPRLISATTENLANPNQGGITIQIVQDASVVAGTTGISAAELLLEELEIAHSSASQVIYLCCVNRGVLDDALIVATERHLQETRALLEKITKSVSLFPDSPPCWPLENYPSVAVWPMDMESLFITPEDKVISPAVEMLNLAIDAEKWPLLGECDAKSRCPFCISRDQISNDRERMSLLSMLRWYELGSGKRLSFRDLFSLFSYLLAGHNHSAGTSVSSPCAWAASLSILDEQGLRRSMPSIKSSTAIFELVSAQYHHALFHQWDREVGSSLLLDIKDLGLQGNNIAMGLHWFLNSRRSAYLPAMIEGIMNNFSRLLDPALAPPETIVKVNRSTSYMLRDIDTRFSRSVSEGLEYVRKSKILTALEVDLLNRLAELDTDLSRQELRRKRPAVATRVQRILRDFSCRLVRRSIGCRTATVMDAKTLLEFQQVVEDKDNLLVFDVSNQIEDLLNDGANFEVSLTTTFGQPPQPLNTQALLVAPKRNVQPAPTIDAGRPNSPLRFLEVGEGSSAQNIALTYELFKAVKDTGRGMSSASLPRSVLALLGTTSARLAGPIVRDDNVLRRAKIKLGNGIEIEQRRADFHVVGGKRNS